MKGSLLATSLLWFGLGAMAPALPTIELADVQHPPGKTTSTFYVDAPTFRKMVEELPKTELHTHLEGAVRPQTIMDLADSYGLPAPASSVAQLKELVGMRSGETLSDFLKKFEPFRFVFDHPDALRRVAREMLEENAREHVMYMEIRINPVKHLDKLSIGEVLDAVLAGLEEGKAKYPVDARLIASINRSYPVEQAMEVAREAVARKSRGIVGLDLAGDEVHFPAANFAEVFQYAASQGLHVTIHAGEALGPESIQDAVDKCGAERIGHGVRLRENPAIEKQIQARHIVLEMCPTSNLLINVVQDLRGYPLARYEREGIPTTLSTDDRHIFGLTLAGEYFALARNTGMSLQELEKVSRNGVLASFLPEGEKAELLRRFDLATLEFEARWEKALGLPTF